MVLLNNMHALYHSILPHCSLSRMVLIQIIYGVMLSTVYSIAHCSMPSMGLLNIPHGFEKNHVHCTALLNIMHYLAKYHCIGQCHAWHCSFAEPIKLEDIWMLLKEAILSF